MFFYREENFEDFGDGEHDGKIDVLMSIHRYLNAHGIYQVKMIY